MTAPDDAAVEAILTAHGADLLRYLQRRAGDEAPDLFGASMVVAWRKRRSMPAEASEARLWLFGMARMTLRGHWRDAGRSLRLTAKLHQFACEPSAADGDDALDVRAAIASLPDDQAELVTLVHWEGFPLADAAAIVGVNASTARGRYQRARESLAVVLATPTDRSVRPVGK